MPTYFVATVTRYVLVDAEDESAARIAGQAALYDLYADMRHRWGREVPIEIHTIRPATTDEIDMMKCHNEMMAREAEHQRRQNAASER